MTKAENVSIRIAENDCDGQQVLMHLTFGKKNLNKIQNSLDEKLSKKGDS